MKRIKKVIYIAGVARSGTSWVGQIFDSSLHVRFRFQPLFSYEFKNKVNEDSSSQDFTEFFENLYESTSPFLVQEDKREKGEYPNFLKDEFQDFLVFKENRYQSIIEPMVRKVPNLKMVCIIRNPCAVLNSWMKNEKEFPNGAEPLEEWRFGKCKNQGNEDYFGYYKWKEVAHLYIDLKDKYPNSIFILKYEDMVDNALTITKEMFEFTGIPLTNQTVDFINASTSTHKDSYYAVFKNKSVKDKWRNELDPYIIAEIEADLVRTRLEIFIK